MVLHHLTYELSVLAKAIQHKNLTAAAVHVGLSQPQLSRLIAKIETELNVILLDRSARRKSGWTPIAMDLALTFTKGLTRLQTEILSLASAREQTELHIGTLEGLSNLAIQFAKQCFEQLGMKTVFLDIYEFADLDSHFISGNLDMIFTVKTPGKQKHQRALEVGYQQMERVTSQKEIAVLSPFEHSGEDKKNLDFFKHVLISNSLAVRSRWLHEFGGTGTLPIDAKKGKGKGYYSVFLVGSDLLSPSLWSRIEKLF
jgi:DNA-binding transcriptional LysR family regulator